MKKRVLSLILAAVMMCGLCPVGRAILPWQEKVGFADSAMVATPTNQQISANGKTVHIPIYSITQSNGYGANYIRLRDYAALMDVDVLWDANEPNAMRIYTTRHYLDNWIEEGEATETKVAYPSAMDIYIDDVKVTSTIQPVLIDNNNFFKMRDLAKLLNMYIAYAPATYKTPSKVAFRNDFYYFEGDDYTVAEKRPATEYESSVWYGGDSGTLSDTPVTYSARDAWGKEDYWNSELNKEYREYLESVKWENNPINPSEFNALVQLLLDTNKTATDSSGQQKENVYYRYPMTEHFLYPSLYSDGLWGCSNLPDLEIIENLSSNMAQECYVVQIAEKGSIWSSTSTDTVVDGHCTSTAPFLVRATQIYAADVINKSKTFATNREQVTYLAQQLCERMTYIGSLEWKQLQEQGKLGDGTGDDVYNYSVWKNRDVIYGGVCMGYTSHFSALAAAAGFYVITYGVAENGDVDHSRNAVWLEDEGCWVAVDCTWADAYQNYLMGTGDRDDYICYDDGVPHWRMGSGPAKIYTAALQLSGDIRRANGEIKVIYTPTKDTTSIKTDSNVNDNNSLTNADASDDYGDIGITTPAENETAPERATIIFDANGGSWTDGSTTMNVAYEAGYCNALPPNPKRDGYTFWSWGYDCVWGESQDFPETCMSLSAGTNLEGKDGLVVQAIWKKK